MINPATKFELGGGKDPRILGNDLLLQCRQCHNGFENRSRRIVILNDFVSQWFKWIIDQSGPEFAGNSRGELVGII